MIGITLVAMGIGLAQGAAPWGRRHALFPREAHDADNQNLRSGGFNMMTHPQETVWARVGKTHSPKWQTVLALF